MLLSLHVKNLALIEESELTFGEGLNILTGETGAGKSVLIGSVNLALGAKADNDMIRSGADSALVELVFGVDEEVKKALLDMDLYVEDDTVIIRRILQPGRSVIKVNGETVTLKQLREISPLLLDLHGQHEHQSLLYPDKQLACLDAFAGTKLKAELTKYREIYEEYRKVKKALKEDFADDVNTSKELAITEYEYNEITEAALKPGEEEELAAVCKRMDNLAKISEHIREAEELLSDDMPDGAQSKIGRAIRSLLQIASMDNEISDMTDTLSSAGDILNDFLRELHDYSDRAVFDEETYKYSVERLNLIRHLEDKFGPTVEAVIAYGEKCEERIEHLRNFEEEKERLLKKKTEIEETLSLAAGRITEIRKNAATELKQKLEPLLMDMNFLAADFEVEFSEKEDFADNGRDEIAFLISTNPGEQRKLLSNVASGGEMSRIMLAFKTLLAKKDAIGTLIFDEIDTGISGRTAWKVACRMAELSKSHQVIAITHLPQIASMADLHFCIAKSADTGVTVTNIAELDKAGRIAELARLLGSDEVSEAGRNNAISLMEEAISYKQNI